MRDARLQQRLARLRKAHQAASITVMYCEPFARTRWNIDVDIHHLGGFHRIGAASTLQAALKQAEAQVPGSTVPLHNNGREDHKTCRAPGCSHFRIAHGRDHCRVPGCECIGYTERARATTADLAEASAAQPEESV